MKARIAKFPLARIIPVFLLALLALPARAQTTFDISVYGQHKIAAGLVVGSPSQYIFKGVPVGASLVVTILNNSGTNVASTASFVSYFDPSSSTSVSEPCLVIASGVPNFLGITDTFTTFSGGGVSQVFCNVPGAANYGVTIPVNGGAGTIDLWASWSVLALPFSQAQIIGASGIPVVTDTIGNLIVDAGSNNGAPSSVNFIVSAGGGSRPLGIVPVASFTHISTATNTLVKASSGILHTITVNGGTAGAVTIVDTSVAACTGGTTIGVTASVGATPVTLTYDAKTANGICITTAAATDLTVTWN